MPGERSVKRKVPRGDSSRGGLGHEIDAHRADILDRLSVAVLQCAEGDGADLRAGHVAIARGRLAGVAGLRLAGGRDEDVGLDSQAILPGRKRVDLHLYVGRNARRRTDRLPHHAVSGLTEDRSRLDARLLGCAAQAPGVSGGGVLSQDGDLVGIPIGRMQGDFRFSFILPLRPEMFRNVPNVITAEPEPAEIFVSADTE